MRVNCFSVFLIAVLAFHSAHAASCDVEPDEYDYCIDATCGLPIANPNLLHPCECTQENIGFEFTECNTTTNTRSIVYYWKPPASCSGGVTLPNHIESIPCSLQCGAGQFLDLNTHACQVCSPGTYSPGGGLVWQEWNTLPAQFETVCAVDSLTKTCNPWRAMGKTIDSGDNYNFIQNNMESVLYLQFHLVVDGKISFQFKVSAEQGNDFFMFVVDDLGLFEVSNMDWTTFVWPLRAGYHEVQWIYRKDPYISSFEDKVTIQTISITGTSVANLACKACPAGKFASAFNSSLCTDCPSDHFSTGNASQCTPCPEGKTSFPGSSTCTVSADCTQYALTYSLTPCVNGVQNKTYRWITPAACDVDTPLPASEPVACVPLICGDGSQNVNGTCVYCPDGEYSTAFSSGICIACPPSTISGSRNQYFNMWESWPANFTTACVGACISNGWRLATEFIDSGTGAEPGTASWVQFETSVVGAGNVSFQYSLSCTGDSYLTMHIDDQIITRINCEEYPDTGCYSNITTVTQSLAAGYHTIRWTFNKGLNTSDLDHCDRALIYGITVSGVTAGLGGPSHCYSCTTGTYSMGTGEPYCFPCPAGSSSSSPTSTSCTTCPENTFSRVGSPQCYACGHATTSPQNSSSCSFNCSSFTQALLSDMEDPKNLTYDISHLTTSAFKVSDVNSQHPTRVFTISLCGTRPTMCGNNSMACMQDNEDQPPQFVDVGNVIAFYPLDNTKGLKIVMTNPMNDCGITILMPCSDLVNAVLSPQYNHDNSDPQACQFSFDFPSHYACPLCTQSDYYMHVSPCINGKETTAWVAENLCHDGVALPAPGFIVCDSETVSVKQSTVVGIVLGVVFGVLIVVGLIAYLVISKRKVQLQYSQLTRTTKSVPEDLPPLTQSSDSAIFTVNG